VIRLGPTDHGRTVPAHAGDEIEVRLPERSTAGFRWRAATDGGRVCHTVEESRIPGPAVGGENTHRWLFRAADAGTAELRFVYGRSFGDAVPSDEVSIRIEVS
jgi:predicted secreted protein